MMQQRPPMPLQFETRKEKICATPNKKIIKQFGGMNTKQFGVMKPDNNTCSFGVTRGRLETGNTESSSLQSSLKRSNSLSSSIFSASSDESSNESLEETDENPIHMIVDKRAEVEGRQKELLPDSSPGPFVIFPTHHTDYGTLSSPDSAIEEVNMMKSSHKYSSSDRIDTKYLPTYIEDNVTLVTDGRLERGKPGKLYVDEESLNAISRTPEYVLSVHPDAYDRVVNGIDEAPYGLYSCLHGKDSASGTSHDDYVDIRVAVLLVSAMMGFAVYVTYF